MEASGRRGRRALRMAMTIAVLAPRLASAAGPLPHYRLAARLSAAAPQLQGTVEVRFTNTATQPIRALVWLLFPNRFAAPDPAVNDVNRPYVYPREEFDPGGMELTDVRVDGQAAVAEEERAPLPLPTGSVLRVRLPAPLAPGATLTASVGFRTRVPDRFGSFGHVADMLTAVGGWYPYLAAVNADGTWAVDALPPLADFDVQLDAPADLEVVLNGRYFGRGASPVAVAVRGVHDLTLIASPRFLRDDVQAGPTRIIFLHRPARYADRRSPGPSQLQITLAALRDIVSQRPPGVPPAGETLVVVEAPLRLYLTAPAEGMVVISDRALKVVWLLRPLHEAQLAQAIYAELLRPEVAPRESAADYGWVSEGLSHTEARAYVAAAYPHTRSVQGWIDLFNIFAIVDRFETAPKIPFVNAFFERSRTLDPLHEQITSFNNDLPPGHVVLGKLQQRLGAARFQTVLQRCTAGSEPFRACAAAASGTDLSAFFDQWLQPYPHINYSFRATQLNQRRTAGYHTAVTVQRQSTREIHEPVDVQLRSIGGQAVRLRWEGDGSQCQLEADTACPVCEAIIDPDRKLIETTRADNYAPFDPQLVLDSADVEVSSTEFGFSALAVARGRYDYRKDIAIAGIYTNRGIGADVGPRVHWGTPNDPTNYRHNLYAFYTVQALDRSFTDKQHPTVRTTGHLNGLGARYNYTTVVAFDNPTHAVDANLFADWYDSGLNSSFSYVDWGGSLTLTHPLWTYRTILAGELLNGFSEPLGSSRVPNQGLFSLGGSRSIRGIGAEEELARNIAVWRGELRQDLYPEVDLNLLDLLVLRRIQLRGFVDTGRVSNSAGVIYDPNGYAVGVGTALALMYDFMGFFPSVAYVEVATRVDRASQVSDVQFLFGTRQAF